MLARSRPRIDRVALLLLTAALACLMAAMVAPRIHLALGPPPAAKDLMPAAVEGLFGTWIMDEPEITADLRQRPRLIVAPNLDVTFHVANRMGFKAGRGSLRLGLLRPDFPLISTTDLWVGGSAGDLESRARHLFGNGAVFRVTNNGSRLELAGFKGERWHFVREPATDDARPVIGTWILEAPGILRDAQQRESRPIHLSIGPTGIVMVRVVNHHHFRVDPAALAEGRLVRAPGGKHSMMIPGPPWDIIEDRLHRIMNGGSVRRVSAEELVLATPDGEELRFRREFPAG